VCVDVLRFHRRQCGQPIPAAGGNLHRSHSPGRQTRRFARSGPDKYTLIINLKTAKALGLMISREMMLIADELLE